MHLSRSLFFLLCLSLLGNLLWLLDSQEKTSASEKVLVDRFDSQWDTGLIDSQPMPSQTNADSLTLDTEPAAKWLLSSEADRLEQLFERNQFDQLATEWEKFFAYAPDHASQLKGQWLIEVERWLQAKEVGRGLHFLDAWLARFANDMDALWIKKTDYFRRENNLAALDAMFSLVDQSYGVKFEIYSYQKK